MFFTDDGPAATPAYAEGVAAPHEATRTLMNPTFLDELHQLVVHRGAEPLAHELLARIGLGFSGVFGGE